MKAHIHIHRPSLTKTAHLFLLFVSIFHAKNIKGPSECKFFIHYYEALSGAAQFNHSTPLLYKVFFTYLEKKKFTHLYCYTPGQDGPVPSFTPHQRIWYLIGFNTMVTVCAFCSNSWNAYVFTGSSCQATCSCIAGL